MLLVFLDNIMITFDADIPPFSDVLAISCIFKLDVSSPLVMRRHLDGNTVSTYNKNCSMGSLSA